MIFMTGPLFAGKRQAAMGLLGWSREELEKKAVWDVQDLAPNAEDLEALARRLAASAACWRSVHKLLCGYFVGFPPCSRGLWDESVSAASWAHGL